MSNIKYQTKLNNFELCDYIKVPDKEKRTLAFFYRLNSQCANVILACDKLCEYIDSSLNAPLDFKLKIDIIENSYNLLIDLLHKDSLLLYNFNEGIINFDYGNGFFGKDFYDEEKAKLEIIKEPMKVFIGDFISKYINLGKCVNNLFISNITEQICDSMFSVLPNILLNIKIYKSDIMKLVSYLNSIFSGDKN